MALERPLHFALDAVVGRDEVGADHQKEEVGGFELSFDLAIKLAASQNVAVIPRLDVSIPREVLEVDMQPIKRRLVVM